MEAGSSHGSNSGGERGSPFRALARRLSPVWILVFAAAWLAVAKSVRADPLPALLAIGVAGFLHAALGGRRGPRLRLGGALRFGPFFLGAAVAGGWDVARRALSPSMPLAPELLVHSMRLPAGPPRVFFINCLSLLPGTFSADLEGRALTVHLLAGDVSGSAKVRELEERVAALFGASLEAQEGEP